jgi:dethiobiotin synthetase
MSQRVFITGISTEVGKTMVSAILTESLAADYWKPVQAGDLQYGDKHKVQDLVSNESSQFFDNVYALNTPMSPHAAAEIDGVQIDLSTIQTPQTDKILIVEGAGGLLVPLNQEQTIADLIQPSDKVVLISRHYLGSINHTLLSCEYLLQKGIRPGLIFSGDEHPTTESIILHKTGLPFLGRLDEQESFDKAVIRQYAHRWQTSVEAWIKE